MRYHCWFGPQRDWDFAERAIKAGLDGFELFGWLRQFPEEEAREYREKAKRLKAELNAGLTVHAPFMDINLGSINSRIRQVCLEEVRDALEFAREVGASAVAVHTAPGIMGMTEGSWVREHPRPSSGLLAQRELAVRAVQDLADFAPDLLLCLENLIYPHELYRSPEEMRELVRRVDRSNVGITLDVGHAAVCGYNPRDFVQLLSDEILHVHLHDNHGSADEHLPPGKGTIDYVGVIQSLKQLDYQGVITFEFELENPEDYAAYLY